MKKGRLVLLLLAAYSLSCEKESVSLETTYIDAELAPYFERFRTEGTVRGVAVDFELANISGFLEVIAAANVTGQCYHSSDDSHRLVIDREFWHGASDLRREFVVFHELGHCFLGRSHLDTALPNGSCASMMHSGLSGCRNAYNSLSRSAYLDELFLEE